MSLQYVEQPDTAVDERDYGTSTGVRIHQHLSIDKPDTIMREKVHITATGLRPHELYRMTMK